MAYLRKIDLDDERLPPVKSPSGPRFENAQGGPYRYGRPILLNAAAIKLLHEGKL